MEAFLKILSEYYVHSARTSLPWRQQVYLDAYPIVVSEVMLQQTQVARVIGYFDRWMRLFPDVDSLAAASTEGVLQIWQGLGYNSRCLRLRKLASIVQSQYAGVFPVDRKELEKLPGIGPYTAGAIRVFVHNLPDVLIETNIRRVIIHHFFSDQVSVADNQVANTVAELVNVIMVEHLTDQDPLYKNPRNFYWAMMDYGSSLPQMLKLNPNTRSKHYVRQSRFEGSVRQVRSGIVKYLLENKTVLIVDIADVLGIVNVEDSRIVRAVIGLEKDGVIIKRDDLIHLT